MFVPRAKQIVNPVVRPKAGTSVGAKASTTASTNRLPTEAQKKASEEAMTKLAAGLRARAAKGEHPDTLQKEAYVAAGLPTNGATTQMGKMRPPTPSVKQHDSIRLDAEPRRTPLSSF